MLTSLWGDISRLTSGQAGQKLWLFAAGVKEDFWMRELKLPLRVLRPHEGIPAHRYRNLYSGRN